MLVYAEQDVAYEVNGLQRLYACMILVFCRGLLSSVSMGF